MAINMFEGARRIAKLIAVFIVVGFSIAIIGASSQTVYLEYPYLITAPGGVPTLGTSCREGAKQESVSITSRRGVDLRVRLCFLYATESRLAFDDLNFQIPESDEGLLNVRWWLQTFKNAGVYFVGMLASLMGLWAFTWVVGWIVRGFVGEPRLREADGSDSQSAVFSRWRPDGRSLMTAGLAFIAVSTFIFSGYIFLESSQRERLAALAETGQREAMKVVEAKIAAERARELVEFQERYEREQRLAFDAIQVWAVRSIGYLNAKDANNHVVELSRHGISAFKKSSRTLDGMQVYVYAGPYQSQAEAEAGRNRLHDVLGFAGSVIRLK